MSLAKRGVSACFVIVEGAVGVDEVDVIDLAFEALRQLDGAAGEGSRLGWLGP